MTKGQRLIFKALKIHEEAAVLESGGNVRHGTVENVSHEPIKLVAN